MKKLMMALVIGLGFGVVHAEDINVTFDNPGRESLNTYIMAKSDIENMAIIKAPEQPQNTGITKHEGQLPPMKEILKNIPSKDRIEFLNSLILKNEHIVSADAAPLKRNLDEHEVSEILNAVLAHPRAAEPAYSESNAIPARLVQMSTLLENVPTDIKNEFLDNMAFKNGGLAAADIGGLMETLNDAKLKEILYALTPKTNNPKTLCGNDLCYYSGCYSGECYESMTPKVCTSSCHN